MHAKTRFMTQAAAIAALYVALTLVARLCGLDSGAVQLRLSEALTVLPVFTAAAIPGLGVGCLIANLLCGAAPWDIVFGALATLIGAVGTRLLAPTARRRHLGWLSTLPPIVANTAIIPQILRLAYGSATPVALLTLSVGAGELISAGLGGTLLLLSLKRARGIRWA